MQPFLLTASVLCNVESLDDCKGCQRKRTRDYTLVTQHVTSIARSVKILVVSALALFVGEAGLPAAQPADRFLSVDVSGEEPPCSTEAGRHHRIAAKFAGLSLPSKLPKLIQC
jgi:hypothetical protein